MSSFIGPLVQESTPSIIADKLRQAIAHGELKPGAQLGEAELARKLGVSRGPLREGMQRLTQEGLLVSMVAHNLDKKQGAEHVGPSSASSSVVGD